MIKLIVASTPDGVIGADGRLPWHYKADLIRFKKLTMGGSLIMGRATWESLPFPLPGRRQFVLTNEPDRPSKHPAGSCTYVRGWGELLELAEPSEDNSWWVCGGSSVYEQALQLGLVDEIDYTMVPPVDLSGKQNVVYVGRRLRLALEYRYGAICNPDDVRLTHFVVDQRGLNLVMGTVLA